MIEIKPCPFCGNDDVRYIVVDKKLISNGVAKHRVICDCDCRGPSGWSEYEAIEAWNKREHVE